MRSVGILGGMGPAATLDFMAKIYAVDRNPVEQERVRLIVDCNPAILDRNAGVRGAGPSPGPALAAMAKGLVGAGADFLVIACNTAHAWLGDIEGAVAAPVLSMIETAGDEIAQAHPHARRIGLLAGQGCLDAGLYQSAFAARGWQAITPGAAAQAAFMDALYRIKAGAMGEAERADLLACAQACVAAGAQLVLAGCTEVPLLVKAADLKVPLIDPTQALALRTVAYARGADLN